MPRLTPSLDCLTGSVYSALAHRLATFPGETYPFHVGDTWLEPPDTCGMQDLGDSGEGLHRYTPVRGEPALREAIAHHVQARTATPTAVDDVVVTAGATSGLMAALRAIVSPGDEVILLSPYWPLSGGIVKMVGGTPVEVPFFFGSEAAALAAVEAAITPRTVAIYWNTPNNPTGRKITLPGLQQLAQLSRENDLWILADEVYEELVFVGDHHHTRPLAPERTVSIHSFSKAYGMAGNRIGYLVAPPELCAQAAKVVTHCWYSAPTASQRAALRALGERGDRWLATVRPQYAEVGRNAAARLGVEAPEGSTFLFLDVADQLDDTGMMGLLERAVERGLFLAPGASFGPFPTHLRMCFTATEPARTARGVEQLAQLLGR